MNRCSTHIWKCSNEILLGVDFVDSIPGKLNDELLGFGPIIFVNGFHPMVVLIIQAKLSCKSSIERPSTSFLRLVGNRVEGLEM